MNSVLLIGEVLSQSHLLIHFGSIVHRCNNCEDLEKRYKLLYAEGLWTRISRSGIYMVLHLFKQLSRVLIGEFDTVIIENIQRLSKK
jgi:hypothetical protein